MNNCRHNHRPSQEKLYKLYYAEMFRLCYRYVPDSHTALSILNDGFLKAFKHITKFEENRGHFKPWLKTIMIHTAIDYIRKREKNIKFLNIENVHEKSDNCLPLHDQWEYEDIEPYLMRLPYMTRTVLNLFAFDGLSHKEIAECLHMSEATSRWHLSEARKKMKECLLENNLKTAEHE